MLIYVDGLACSQKANRWINGSARGRRAGKPIDRPVIYAPAGAARIPLIVICSSVGLILVQSETSARLFEPEASEEDKKPFKYQSSNSREGELIFDGCK